MFAAAGMPIASEALADPPPMPRTILATRATLYKTGLPYGAFRVIALDAGDIRTLLGGYRITIGRTETSEVFGSASGGIKQGADYDGLTTATLQLDTGVRARHLCAQRQLP